jgi:CBS domain-containing protein
VTEAQRLTVRDYMSTDVVTVGPDMEVLAAMQRLLDARISGAPVVDTRGNLVGMLTQRDCLEVVTHAVYHGEPAGRVADYMSAPVTTLSAGTSLLDGIEAFRHSRFRRFPVLEGTRLVGLISRRDLLRAILAFA